MAEKEKRSSFMSKLGLPDLPTPRFDQEEKPYTELKEEKPHTDLKSTDAAIAEADALAKDVQGKLATAQQATNSKLEEGISLQSTLQDKDVPLPVKIVKTLEFLKGPLLKAIQFIWKIFCCLLPLYEKIFKAGYQFYVWAPRNVITMVVGLCLCFYGGTYVASLAAIEAFRNMGGERLLVDLLFVYGELKGIHQANLKDEAEAAENPDDDNKTTDELFADEKYAEWAQKKVYMGLAVVKEPKRLESAIGSLWSAYIAVLATLRMQFAQVIAFALGMAETVKPLFERILMPVLKYVMDPTLHHWVPTIISSTLNLIAMWIAWIVISIVASVYSGLRGGRMFAIGLMGLIIEHDLVNKIPLERVKNQISGWFEEEKDPKTGAVTGYKGYLDEVIGYSLAAFGIYSQISSGFSISFPLSIVLFPLSVIEWILRYQITFGGSPAGTSG